MPMMRQSRTRTTQAAGKQQHAEYRLLVFMEESAKSQLHWPGDVFDHEKSLQDLQGGIPRTLSNLVIAMTSQIMTHIIGPVRLHACRLFAI